jgi:3-oxoacyl-[acyl-carrier protein] reductase
MGILDGRVAVVTGGARGIGAATCLRLAKDGASVGVFDINLEGASAVADKIISHGGQAIAIACDVQDRQQVDEGIDKVAEHFGRLDILVNNAGVLRDNLVFKMSDDDWETVINTHLRGSFYSVRAAQKYMVKQKYGKIIMVSSRAALGNRGQTNYAAAKAGLQGMTRALALELGPFWVNVNAVAPGFVESEMTKETAERRGFSLDQLKENFIQNNPLKRVGQPEDVANTIAFLASDDSSFITGQIIYVTGKPTV